MCDSKQGSKYNKTIQMAQNSVCQQPTFASLDSFLPRVIKLCTQQISVEIWHGDGIHDMVTTGCGDTGGGSASLSSSNSVTFTATKWCQSMLWWIIFFCSFSDYTIAVSGCKREKSNCLYVVFAPAFSRLVLLLYSSFVNAALQNVHCVCDASS